MGSPAHGRTGFLLWKSRASPLSHSSFFAWGSPPNFDVFGKSYTTKLKRGFENRRGRGVGFSSARELVVEKKGQGRGKCVDSAVRETRVRKRDGVSSLAPLTFVPRSVVRTRASGGGNCAAQVYPDASLPTFSSGVIPVRHLQGLLLVSAS